MQTVEKQIEDAKIISLVSANYWQELIAMEELDNQNYHHQINRIKEVKQLSETVWGNDSFLKVWLQAHYK